MGDFTGHPFRGNQYAHAVGTRGTVSSASRSPSAGKTLVVEPFTAHDVEQELANEFWVRVKEPGSKSSELVHAEHFAPDLEHLARENKISAKISDEVMRGSGYGEGVVNRAAREMGESIERSILREKLEKNPEQFRKNPVDELGRGRAQAVDTSTRVDRTAIKRQVAERQAREEARRHPASLDREIKSITKKLKAPGGTLTMDQQNELIERRSKLTEARDKAVEKWQREAAGPAFPANTSRFARTEDNYPKPSGIPAKPAGGRRRNRYGGPAGFKKFGGRK